MPDRARSRSVRSEIDDALDGLRDLGGVVSALGGSARSTASGVRALAEDGVRALGVRSTSTQKALADLIATLSSSALRGPLLPGGRGGGGGGGFFGDIADAVGDFFSFSAPPEGGEKPPPAAPPSVNLRVTSVVADRRQLDRLVREEVEPRLRALWASRTKAAP